MVRVILCILFVQAVIFVVPFFVYSLFTVFGGLKPPASASPQQFLTSIFVSKIGTAIAFVLIFYVARDVLGGKWFLYAVIWWVMFALGEVGQAIGPNYSWKEAAAGVIAETIYFPASAYIANRVIGLG